MWAHIERGGQCEKQCSGCIRIFEDWYVFGGPYRYSFPFVMFDETTIELQGIVGRAPTPSEGRAMLRACKAAGLRVMRERKSGARLGTREITRRFNEKE